MRNVCLLEVALVKGKHHMMAFMYILLLMIPPVVGGLVAKHYLHKTITWTEYSLISLIVLLACSIVIGTGFYTNLSDVEILNGMITEKKREHGTYLQSYSCNCSTSCSGSGNSRSCSQVCQTCYRRHYTVTWYATSTLGNIGIDSADTTSRSVYNLPDPPEYVRCYKGEPASKNHVYKNYVRAVPESLFNTKQNEISQYNIPRYPTVHSIYKVSRVLRVGSGASKKELDKLNKMLSDELRYLGASKEVNIIAIFTNVQDPAYRNVVENAWIGGKKNDVVLFFGTDGNRILWHDTMTWALNSGNELFVATMNQDFMDMGGIVNAEKITKIVVKNINALYTRPKMEKYKYLMDEIEPPVWSIILSALLSVFGSFGLIYVFHKNEVV